MAVANGTLGSTIHQKTLLPVTMDISYKITLIQVTLWGSVHLFLEAPVAMFFLSGCTAALVLTLSPVELALRFITKSWSWPDDALCKSSQPDRKNLPTLRIAPLSLFLFCRRQTTDAVIACTAKATWLRLEVLRFHFVLGPNPGPRGRIITPLSLSQFHLLLDINPDPEFQKKLKIWLRIRIQGCNHNTSDCGDHKNEAASLPPP